MFRLKLLYSDSGRASVKVWVRAKNDSDDSYLIRQHPRRMGGTKAKPRREWGRQVTRQRYRAVTRLLLHPPVPRGGAKSSEVLGPRDVLNR